MMEKLKIGAVVAIKNEIKKIMIIGYDNDQYLGVLFPLGYINKDQNISFTDNDIVDIYSIGYKEG